MMCWKQWLWPEPQGGQQSQNLMHVAMLKISGNRIWESSTSLFAVPAIFHCKLVPFSVGTNSVFFFSISMVVKHHQLSCCTPKRVKVLEYIHVKWSISSWILIKNSWVWLIGYSTDCANRVEALVKIYIYIYVYVYVYIYMCVIIGIIWYYICRYMYIY